MYLLVWHREPEYPFTHLQITTGTPNRSIVAHDPPLRHGHLMQVDVEVVGLVVMVEVVVIVEVVVMVAVVVIVEVVVMVEVVVIAEVVVMVVGVVVVMVVVTVVVEGVGVGREHTLSTGFILTSFVLTKLLPSESLPLS